MNSQNPKMREANIDLNVSAEPLTSAYSAEASGTLISLFKKPAKPTRKSKRTRANLDFQADKIEPPKKRLKIEPVPELTMINRSPEGSAKLQFNNGTNAPPNAIIWHLSNSHYVQMENGKNIPVFLKDPAYKYEFEFKNGTPVPEAVIVREYYKEFFLQLTDGSEIQIFTKGSFLNNYQYTISNAEARTRDFHNIYGDAVENRLVVDVIPEGVVPRIIDQEVFDLINYYPASMKFTSFFSGRQTNSFYMSPLPLDDFNDQFVIDLGYNLY